MSGKRVGREERRRRRRRTQRITFSVAGVLLLFLIAGGCFGAMRIAKAMEEKELQQTEDAQTEDAQPQGEETESAVQTEPTAETEGLPEEETEEESAPGEEALLEEQIETCIAGMTLEEKVAGLFFVTPEAITGVKTAVQAGEGTREALAKYPVGGLVYFKQNIQSEDQIREMLEKTASYSKYPLFLGVDEEGGTVARVADALGLENVGDMAAIGETGDSAGAYEAGAKIGGYLQSYGFNVDFAPVADIWSNPENDVIGKRAFGSDAALVSEMVASAVQGLQETGVSACLKHFPGHGDTSGDSHEMSVITQRTLEEMQQSEFLPFQSGMEAGVDMVMVGHISAPQLTGGDMTPASMSETIITDILRKQLGYRGIVITDAMNMGAIANYYPADEAAIKALRAGADMVLMPENFETAYEGVVQAVKEGVISEERINDSLRRIYRVKCQ